jgi:hypothetical protein
LQATLCGYAFLSVETCRSLESLPCLLLDPARTLKV